MRYHTEERRRFETGRYLCPVKKIEVLLEADVPRARVPWPVHIQCEACGEEHLLEYEDVLHAEPAFGKE